MSLNNFEKAYEFVRFTCFCLSYFGRDEGVRTIHGRLQKVITGLDENIRGWMVNLELDINSDTRQKVLQE